MESRLQTKIVKWLKDQGCWVMKTRPGPGTPVGTADIFFCKEGFYGWLEVKASRNAKVQPLQRSFVDKMAKWSYARFVYPENWGEVRTELERIL